jgi:P4 family phage/plasmid primase-like protien
MRLDEAKVKKITGNDSITAAAKYKNPVTFVPNFLWLLHGNERVRVTVDDDAIWRRIKQIPFKESTIEAEVKEEIRNRLLTDQACHDAVLRWAVDGLRRFQADRGLKPFPKEVERETREYRAAMNPLADFVRDYCVLEENAEVLAANLRGKYIWWCDQQNLPIRDRLGDNEIAKHLKRLNCEQAKERGGDRRRTWVGISLK